MSIETLTWRMSPWRRAVVVVTHAVLFVALVVILTLAPSVGLAVTVVVLAVILGWNALAIRRSCVLDDQRLTLHGRFATRTVELRDLRQVALSISQFAWVRTHHPLDEHGTTTLSLAMIPGKRALTQADLLIAREAVPIIRARAEAAGATLDPLPAKGTPPPLTRRGMSFGR